jgi:hypothetical protein
MASRKQLKNLGENLMDAEVAKAEAPAANGPLLCTAAEMMDMVRMDPEQRARREQEIRNRPPSPPQPEPTLGDVLETMQRLRSEIEDQHMQLLDNVLDTKEILLGVQEEHRILRELIERAVDGG